MVSAISGTFFQSFSAKSGKMVYNKKKPVSRVVFAICETVRKTGGQITAGMPIIVLH
jgi:hypothetical protein